MYHAFLVIYVRKKLSGKSYHLLSAAYEFVEGFV